MVNCPICESVSFTPSPWRPRDYEYGVEADFGFRSCNDCGIAVASPLPEPSHIKTFYPPEYTAYGNTSGRVNTWIMDRYADGEAKRFQKRWPKETRVLDVGCGAGDFLSALSRAGFGNTVGLESDPDAVSFAKAQGRPVKIGEFERTDWPEESFDVIRMNHSLEHFHSPAKALAVAWRALRPGGVLIGETPNTDCLDFRLFGSFWGGWHFPRHLWMFSRPSLKVLAEKNGFRVAAVKNCYRTVGWSAGVQNWLVDKLSFSTPRGGRFRWYPILILAFLPLTFLQKFFGKTAVMEFTLRKEPA